MEGYWGSGFECREWDKDEGGGGLPKVRAEWRDTLYSETI
jgi:hypothetical protein